MKKTSKRPTQLIDGLSRLLADTYLLYLKTQNFHWNIGGPHFYSLHKMFEAQYEELGEAADTIAERIRALNAPAPGSFSAFLKLTSLDEADSEATDAEMVTLLLCDHETMGANLTKLFAVAEAAGDEVTLDMLISRKAQHDKTAWMLRSTLEQ